MAAYVDEMKKIAQQILGCGRSVLRHVTLQSDLCLWRSVRQGSWLTVVHVTGPGSKLMQFVWSETVDRSVQLVFAMTEPEPDHQRRFQAAVDVIHNLPRTGWYRPPHQVMLRFYSLYKQSVFGPCRVSRPGFWDPVGRIKWDAWSSLGEMSSDGAMAAYVDEMKKIAQQVIDTVPMNEKTASIFKHFEPLYLEIHDMPRPPDFLFKEPRRSEGLEGSGGSGRSEGLEGSGGSGRSEGPGGSKKSAPASDSESETFCDSVDCVDQQGPEPGSPPGGRQAGAGHGGEGPQDGRSQGPPRRNRDRDQVPRSRREGRDPPNGPRRGSMGVGPGGGGGSEEGAEQHEAHLQQQIVLTLQRLREDMRSVMERLEAVEELAGAEPPQERWWSLDIPSSTLLLFLLWPFAAQVLLLLLKRGRRRRS